MCMCGVHVYMKLLQKRSWNWERMVGRGWEDTEIGEGRRRCGINTVYSRMNFSNLKLIKLEFLHITFKNTGLENKILLYCIIFQMKGLSSARPFTILKSTGYSFNNIKSIYFLPMAQSPLSTFTIFTSLCNYF